MSVFENANVFLDVSVMIIVVHIWSISNVIVFWSMNINLIAKDVRSLWKTGYYKDKIRAYYQKDGEYYFNSFSFPDTNVGGRFYGAKGLNLEEDDQKYIYTLCEVANKNLKKDVIDPLIIMSICAHETGSQADAINKNSKTTGYMQLFPFYVIDYCESDLTDGEPYYTIYGFYEYVKLITPKEKMEWNYRRQL